MARVKHTVTVPRPINGHCRNTMTEVPSRLHVEVIAGPTGLMKLMGSMIAGQVESEAAAIQRAPEAMAG